MQHVSGVIGNTLGHAGLATEAPTVFCSCCPVATHTLKCTRSRHRVTATTRLMQRGVQWRPAPHSRNNSKALPCTTSTAGVTSRTETSQKNPMQTASHEGKVDPASPQAAETSGMQDGKGQSCT